MGHQFSKGTRRKRYAIVLICCLTRRLFTAAMNRKTPENVIAALESFFQANSDMRPYRIYCDAGKEFRNRKMAAFLANYDTALHSPLNKDIKCSMAERVIQTIKKRIARFLRDPINCGKKWTDALPNCTEDYNNTPHDAFNYRWSPASIRPKDIKELHRLLYPHLFDRRVVGRKKGALKIGDLVRISEEKKTFRRGFNVQFSSKLYRIRQIIRKPMPIFRLETHEDDPRPVPGIFYREQLSPVIVFKKYA